VRPNPDDPTGKSMMRRVPEVLDCWFESGSMPFAQAHYPFENKAWVDNHNADFIVEYIAQTRGWFYTMHVLSVALFDRPAFKNCICHGVVLDEDGRKLSKRLRNYPDPEEVFETIGSDALRWFLMSSPILRGLDLRIDREGRAIGEIVRLVLNPIWNSYTFFTLYANVDRYRATVRASSTQQLDRYILAKTRALVERVTERLDAYDIAGACSDIQGFLDALNNWYIRRSRERFWAPAGGIHEQDKHDAYDTLYTVLHTVTRVAAPLLPFLCEEVYTNLSDDESVHLADWPDPASLPADDALVSAMDRVRDVCSAALSLRETRGLRTRLPLSRLTIAGDGVDELRPFAELIGDEVNVKSVEFSDDVAQFGSFVLRPNGKVLGPRLGGAVQQVIKAARAGEWTTNADGTITVAGVTLGEGDFELALQAKDGEATAPLRGNDAVVNLDTEVTDELRDEGTARDLVRQIQEARKKQDLVVTDRIELFVELPPALETAIRAHEPMIKGEVLATNIEYAQPPAGGAVHEARLENQDVRFSVVVA
jgi:isoleucyl-tRNA synthetase